MPDPTDGCGHCGALDRTSHARDCPLYVDPDRRDDQPRSVAHNAYTRTGVALGELRDV